MEALPTFTRTFNGYDFFKEIKDIFLYSNGHTKATTFDKLPVVNSTITSLFIPLLTDAKVRNC